MPPRVAAITPVIIPTPIPRWWCRAIHLLFQKVRATISSQDLVSHKNSLHLLKCTVGSKPFQNDHFPMKNQLRLQSISIFKRWCAWNFWLNRAKINNFVLIGPKTDQKRTKNGPKTEKRTKNAAKYQSVHNNITPDSMMLKTKNKPDYSSSPHQIQRKTWKNSADLTIYVWKLRFSLQCCLLKIVAFAIGAWECASGLSCEPYQKVIARHIAHFWELLLP